MDTGDKDLLLPLFPRNPEGSIFSHEAARNVWEGKWDIELDYTLEDVVISNLEGGSFDFVVAVAVSRYVETDTASEETLDEEHGTLKDAFSGTITFAFGKWELEKYLLEIVE